MFLVNSNQEDFTCETPLSVTFHRVAGPLKEIESPGDCIGKGLLIDLLYIFEIVHEGKFLLVVYVGVDEFKILNFVIYCMGLD
jgi:hypothetical protein